MNRLYSNNYHNIYQRSDEAVDLFKYFLYLGCAHTHNLTVCKGQVSIECSDHKFHWRVWASLQLKLMECFSSLPTHLSNEAITYGVAVTEKWTDKTTSAGQSHSYADYKSTRSSPASRFIRKSQTDFSYQESTPSSGSFLRIPPGNKVLGNRVSIQLTKIRPRICPRVCPRVHFLKSAHVWTAILDTFFIHVVSEENWGQTRGQIRGHIFVN